MNRAYKLVWNTVSNSWIVASELAKSGKKSSGKALKLALVTAAAVASAGAFAVAPPAAGQLPVGELGVNGTVTFDRSVTNQLTMNQTSASAMTIWESFDVGSNAKVIINQPNSSSISFNTVLNPTAVTQIFGQVQSNGQFILTNPSGIIFGVGSQVSASSIVAASLQWDTVSGGYLEFTKAGNIGFAPASIENYGSLTATGGSVTLLSPNIINQGSIQATGGDVNLLFADDVGISNATPNIITPSSTQSFIQNTGNITATQVSSVGGKILLTGDTSQAASQIQLAGTLDATTNTNINGRSILVNGDVNLNGDSNMLDFTTTDGYSLNSGSAVNLNGASSGFSVNGTAYTVVRDVNQLQAMGSNLTGKYVLANNIDASVTSSWNGGTGFVPVGSISSKFTGILDGLGHSVNNLYINRPDIQNGTGLLGVIQNAKVSNIGLLGGSITGQGSVGSLAGFVSGGNTLYRVYSSATVNGTESVGGIAGVLGSSTDNLNYAYFSGNASSEGTVGGLVGDAGFAGISYGYFAGRVTGSQNTSFINYAGGVAGYSEGNIQYSYADGQVTGAYAGGITGYSGLSSAGLNYWNTATTGQSAASYDGNGNVAGIGLNNNSAKQLASYANWGNRIDAQGGTGTAWRIYEGQSGPLLRSFLRPLTIGGDQNRTYDGTTLSSPTLSYSRNNVDFSKILGTASVSGTAVGARNVGSYSLDVSGGLYSTDQFGYDIGFASGTLNITAANLTISSSDVTKTYDAITNANGSAVVTAGSLFGTDSLSGGTFAFADKNAGTGKTVMVSGVMVNDGNGGNNYNISYADNTSSTINKRLLTLTATDASKVYDGKLTSAGKPTVVGRQRGDSIVGLTQSYLDKNAGTGKTINVNAGYTIRDGNGGNNYDVVIVNSTAGVITPKALTISTVANSKVYDGGLTSANKPLVTGLVTGDSVSGLFQQYETKTVGENKKLLLKAGYVVRDGNDGGNYSVTEQGSMDGVITAH